MKKILFIGIISVAILMTGCSKKPTEPVANTAPLAQKKTVIEAFGTVQIKDKMNINLDFQASIEKVHVVDGQRIKALDPLITLNLKDYKATISNKQKELNISNLEVAQAKDNAYIDSTNDPTMKKLENDLKNSQETYDIALNEYKDQEILFKQGVISAYDLAQIQKSLDMKKKDMDDVRFSIEGLKVNREKEESKIVILSEKSTTIKNELSLMNSKLAKPYMKENDIICTVENGIVYDISYVAGDIVDPSRKVLSIMDLDTLYIEAEISEEFLKDVKLNATATVIPTADKSKEYRGKVTFISNNAIIKNGETIIPIHILLDSADEFLIPNMNVDVNIEM